MRLGPVSQWVCVIFLCTPIATGDESRALPGIQPAALSPSAMAQRMEALPIVRDLHYQGSGAIRFVPLPGMWIRKQNVGVGRLVRRADASGSVAAELLIASDPGRAPRHYNRWGYVAETLKGEESTQLIVAKESDDGSLGAVQARTARDQQQGRFVFKVVRTTGGSSGSWSDVVYLQSERDYTHRDLPAIVTSASSLSGAGQPQAARLVPGVDAGFMFAFLGLIREGADAYRRTGHPAPPATRRYLSEGRIKTLTLQKAHPRAMERLGTRRFQRVIEATFVGEMAGMKELPFVVVYGTEGTWAEVPLRLTFTPRWWFQFELTLTP